MRYSSFRPGLGGFDVFETPEQMGLGDDLPTPIMPRGTDIGVASVDCGRPMPPGARHIGTAELAEGLIVPLDRSALSGIDAAQLPWWALPIGVLLGWVLGRRMR